MNAAERRIRAYEEMGDHRTGRAADNAATGWMIDELASVGVHAEPQEWTFPQVDWDDASVRINGTSVPGVPLFDGALTSVSGNLAEPGSSGIVVSPIAHGDGTQFSQAMYPHLNTLREGGAAAVVLVMGDPDGNHAIRNAERPLDPLDLAVLQVAPNDAAPLLEGAARAQAAQLTIEGWRKTKTAANVVATIPGTDPAAPSHADDAQVGLVHLRRRARRRHRNLDRSRRTSRSRAGPPQPQHRRLQRTRAASPRA